MTQHDERATAELIRKRRDMRRAYARDYGDQPTPLVEPVQFVGRVADDAPAYRSPLDALADSWWSGFGYGMAVSVLVIAVVTGATL